jgi:hypothetical protein
MTNLDFDRVANQACPLAHNFMQEEKSSSGQR